MAPRELPLSFSIKAGKEMGITTQCGESILTDNNTGVHVHVKSIVKPGALVHGYAQFYGQRGTC